MKMSKGFSFIEMILAVLLYSVVLQALITTAIHVMRIKTGYVHQREVAIVQMQQLMTYSSQVTCDDNVLSYLHKGEQFTLSLVNHRLVQEVGYAILMDDVKSFSCSTIEFDIWIDIHFEDGKEFHEKW